MKRGLIAATVAGIVLSGSTQADLAACDDEASRNVVRMAYEVMEDRNAKVLRILKRVTVQSVKEGKAEDTYNLIKSLEKLIQLNDDVLSGVTTDLNNRLAGLCD